jgi:hypothetical protein
VSIFCHSAQPDLIRSETTPPASAEAFPAAEPEGTHAATEAKAEEAAEKKEGSVSTHLIAA